MPIGGKNCQNNGTFKWPHRSNKVFLTLRTYDEQLTIEKNGAISSCLVTQRLYIKHKTAEIPALQKLTHIKSG